MDNEMNSASALEKFAEKIDFTKLEGKPEGFYQAGLAFVENGQFDDGIAEFVKIIKTVSHQESLFVNAVKELKSMGFSNADISAISGSPETVKDIIADLVLTPSAPSGSKNNPGIKQDAQKPSGKPLGVVSVLTLTIGGCLFVSGLLLYLTSMASRTEGAWVDRAGFGEFFGLIALIPGLIILGLWYLFHRLN